MATRLALEFPVSSVILIAPFVSVKRVAEDTFWPLGWFVSSDIMSNEQALEKITCPVLFFHGERDTLIPPEHSKLLMEKVRHEKKFLVICPEMGHNTNIIAVPAAFSTFASAILSFCNLPDYDFGRELTIPDGIFAPPLDIGGRGPRPSIGDDSAITDEDVHTR